MLKCREVTELVGADSVAQAPWRTRLAFRLHLLMCRHCRAYVRSLRHLAATARRLAMAEAPPSDTRASGILDAVQRHRSSFAQCDRDAK